MTEIIVDPGPGPRLHAFVIGVGQYPNCDNPPVTGIASRVLGDLGSVTSPPPSAGAVAEWLLRAPRGEGDLPVGTVEVLISAPEPATVGLADGDGRSVDGATFERFKAAFRRWRRRCDTDPGNIAFFYFCGHGWHLDGQLLLLEDFGADPDALLENAVELSEVRTLMQHCRARSQLYCIEACRQMPTALFQVHAEPGRLMDRPEQVTLPLAPLDAPVYFSTAQRYPSEVDRAAVTPFTVALLRTLDGLGAHRVGAGPWRVATDRFGMYLRDVIAWDNPGTDRSALLTFAGEQCGSSVLRTLDGPPRVPFRLMCAPERALPAAVVSMRQLEARQDQPIPVAPDGVGEVVAGAYRLDLAFPNAEFSGASVFAEVLPPNKTWHAQVEPA